MHRLIRRSLLSLALSSIAATPLYAAEPAACKNVRLGVVNWTDVIATSAMAQVLLDGLGYQTKQTSASQQIIFAGIRDKRLDMFLGYWNPIMTQTITPFVDANQVKVLEKPSLEDARATLAVPKYLYDKGLKTFADIHKFEKELGGKIYGIEPGSGANTQIKAMISKNQFELGKFQLVERRTLPQRPPPAGQPELQRRGREPHDAAAARPQGRAGIGPSVAQGSPRGQGPLA